MKNFKEMENTFYKDVRQQILEGLKQCTEAQQLLFKRMYANGNLELSIEKVVTNMNRDKLDWASQQVQRTLEKKR